MFDRICDRQADVLEAVSTGRHTNAGIAGHLASCASCRDAAESVRWMENFNEPAGSCAKKC